MYGELEQLLGIKIWYDLPLIRTLFNRGEQNDWLARSGDVGYAGYLDDTPALGNLPALTTPVFAYAGVRQAARVDVGGLVDAFRRRLMDGGRIDLRAVDYGNLPREYDRYVFCEGWRVRDNPWFAYLPHGGNKGEVLIVNTRADLLQSMFKHRVFLVPLANGTYWVGATSENVFADDSPTPSLRAYLADRLREVLTVPFTIEDHRAAVRPTVKDRRMLIGAHPVRDNYYLLNGLGTKGASLAPLGSRFLFAQLEHGVAVPPSVNIERWSRPKG